jgi:DNA replication protein DnaC
VDDQEILAQANDMIQQQRKAHPSSAGEPKSIGATIARVMAKNDAIPAATPEELSERELREQARERDRRCGEWERTARRLGVRYMGCTIANFVADTGPQQIVLEKVRAYVSRICENIAEGRSVLLYGPPGTGKDHLATAIMRATAIGAGSKVEWTDGSDFYGAMRDNIDSHQSESSLLARFRDPDLLCISDPVPPRGSVESAFQLSQLFRVVDRRYRDFKATMMTLNVASRAEAEERLSPNVIDRLGHDALILHCNWPSFRKS